MLYVACYMNIVGHKNIITCLAKAMENNAVHHSYIFHGPKNIGKDTVARWFASELLKTPVEKLASHPDFFEVAGEGNISKEQIDGAIERVRFTSFHGGYKIVLVGNAHNMNISSANAFLKTLEEPPQKTVIMLTTPELGKILPTIISRSAVLHFRPVEKEEIRQFLRIQHNSADAKELAVLACGRPGRAINFFSNPGDADYMPKAEEFYNLFFGRLSARFAAANNLSGKKDAGAKAAISEKIDFWLEIIRDVCLYKYNLPDAVIYTKAMPIMEKISKEKSANFLAALGGRLIKMRELTSNNINIKLMLENLII